MKRNAVVNATLQDATYAECFDQAIAAVGATKMKVIYVENTDLNVRKFVVSTPADLAGSSP